MLNVADTIRAEIEANREAASSEDDAHSLSEGAHASASRGVSPIPSRPDLTVDSRYAVEIEGDDVEVGTVTDLANWVARANAITGGAPAPNG